MSAAVLLVLTLVPASALGDTPQSDRVLAQALFEQGRALMDAGQYGDACRKLAESQRLDPAGGTLLNLAICYQKAGRTASAWNVFEDARLAARRDGRPEREQFAAEQIAALTPELCRVTLAVSERARLPGLGIRVDGTHIPDAAWNTAIPFDPGEHEVEVSAERKQSWTTTVRLEGSGAQVTVEVPVLADAAVTAQPASSPPLASPVAPASRSSRTAPSEDAGAGDRRTLGYAVGGFGVLSLAVGGYFGLRAFSEWSERNDNCSQAGCNAEAVDHADKTNLYGNIANVGIGLGVVGVGVGTWLVLTSHEASGSSTSTTLGLRPLVGHQISGLEMGGSW